MTKPPDATMTSGNDNRWQNRWSLASSIVIVLVLIDQCVKWSIVRWIGPQADDHRIEIAGRFLALEYVENRGAAFGILNGQTTLLVVLAFVVGALFLLAYRRDVAGNTRVQIALILIAAGSVGNLIDRVRLGYVVDFLAVGLWPKFNIADSCITIAILLLAWHALSAPDDESERSETYHGTATEDGA